jgi:cytochrome c
MKTHMPGAFALTVLLAATGVQAQTKSPEQLAKDAGCYSCHSATEKVVGPAFKSIADKYRGQKDATDQLVQSVRNGSKGNWGRIPMPAHGSLPEADVKTIVTWILAR